jgi:hypothetical protein
MLDDKQRGLTPDERGVNEAQEGTLVAEYRTPKKDKDDREQWLECYDKRGNLGSYIKCLRAKALAWEWRKQVDGQWPGLYLGTPLDCPPPPKGREREVRCVRPLDKTRVIALLDACNPNGSINPEYLDNHSIETCRQRYDNGKEMFYLEENYSGGFKVIDVTSARRVIEQSGRLPEKFLRLPPETKLQAPRQPDLGAMMNLREVLTR